MTPFEMVREFHEAYGLDAPYKPRELPYKRQKLRFSLIEEEFREYCEAAETGEITEIAKELADLMYVVIGAAVEHGIYCFDEVFSDVHLSNMSKLGDDGRPLYREDGKVIKGPNYRPPDLTYILSDAKSQTPPHSG